MTAEYTPDQTPPRQCPECGGLSGHTADCPNRVDDRMAVVAEEIAAELQRWATQRFTTRGGLDQRGAALWDASVWLREEYIPALDSPPQPLDVVAAAVRRFELHRGDDIGAATIRLHGDLLAILAALDGAPA